MTLILVKNKYVADMPHLTRLVLRHVYERDTMRADEIDLMEKSIVGWAKKININDVQLEILQRLGWYLKKDRDGGFDQRKASFAEKDIDWRKFHRKVFYDRSGKRIY